MSVIHGKGERNVLGFYDHGNDFGMNRMTITDSVDTELLEGWRRDTPGCAHRNHLNNAGAALMPRPVIDAITEHIRLEAGTGGYEADRDGGSFSAARPPSSAAISLARSRGMAR